MNKKHLTFIINPISGNGKNKNISYLIEQEINPKIFDFKILFTDYAGHAEIIAKESVQNNEDVVVAVGGDGTINEVARAIVNTNTALGIIPCGSGNGLARHLHIPINPQKALQLINQNIIHNLDYGMINKHPFFCTCGIGFDAIISKKFSEAGNRGIKTYIEKVLKEGFTYKSQSYIIEDINHKKEYRAFLIACANASQYGNNAYIAPNASMKDGLLDIIIMEPFKPYDIPQIIYQLFNKKIDKNSHIKTFRSSHLKIYREENGVVHYDGDPLNTGKEIEIELIHKKFKVIVNDNIQSNNKNILNLFIENVSEWLKAKINL